jgi:hypothetical protein
MSNNQKSLHLLFIVGVSVIALYPEAVNAESNAELKALKEQVKLLMDRIEKLGSVNKF